MPKSFPIEFRDDVVRVARERGGKPIAQVARDFGVSEACLHRWLKKADAVVLGVPDDAALREMKKRNKVLEQENEILRRAAAFFAKDCSPK